MAKSNVQALEIPQFYNPVPALDSSPNKLTILNQSQSDFTTAMMNNSVVIGAGYAGVGKTYLSARIAGHLYSSKQYKKIILSRPNVEVGEKMGALPGELMEKYAPYMEPFETGLRDELGGKFQKDLYKTILPQPLGYMRGKTFDDSIILIDEAQNISITAMKMILTRIGTNSKLFITGDVLQTDLRGSAENGLQWLIRQIKKQDIPVPIIDFKRSDCVRSDECRMFLDMIANADEE